MNKPESVNIKYVNHGNVFGTKDWFTFYCGNCNRQVLGEAIKCHKCNTILKGKKAYR